MMKTEIEPEAERTVLRSEGEPDSREETVEVFLSTHHPLEILRKKEDLLEEILSSENMKRAWKQVKRNKGAPGIDGCSIEATGERLKTEWPGIKSLILNGGYRPSPVKKVVIPKATGGERTLGIPTVQDRLIQQAVAQVLVSYIDCTFEETSYGFRPGKSAQQAVLQAKEYVDAGFEYSIDVDIEAYFDTINQDRLMSQLKGMIGDQRVLNLIRAFLNSGTMEELERSGKDSGVPQGGPLSPLLANIYLDPLDKEMAKRGHRYTRYADDCCVFVRTERSAMRVLESVKRYLEKKLKLRVNEKKTAIRKGGKLLGFIVKREALCISPESIKKFKDKVRALTPIKGGRALENVLEELSKLIRGWGNYFKIQTANGVFRGLDSWICRRLRALKYESYKNGETRYKDFKRKGFGEHTSHTCAYSNSGSWSMALCMPMRILYSGKVLKRMGHISLNEMR